MMVGKPVVLEVENPRVEVGEDCLCLKMLFMKKTVSRNLMGSAFLFMLVRFTGSWR